MQVLRPRSEDADAPLLRLDARVQRRVLRLVLVHEDEPSAIELASEVAQVQKAGVVERAVRFLVDVRMPVFVVYGLGRGVVDPREERWVCEINGIDVDLELVADCLSDFPPDRFVRVEGALVEEASRFGNAVDVDEALSLRQRPGMQVENRGATAAASETQARLGQLQQLLHVTARRQAVRHEAAALFRHAVLVFHHL